MGASLNELEFLSYFGPRAIAVYNSTNITIAHSSFNIAFGNIPLAGSLCFCLLFVFLSHSLPPPAAVLLQDSSFITMNDISFTGIQNDMANGVSFFSFLLFLHLLESLLIVPTFADFSNC